MGRCSDEDICNGGLSKIGRRWVFSFTAPRLTLHDRARYEMLTEYALPFRIYTYFEEPNHSHIIEVILILELILKCHKFHYLLALFFAFYIALLQCKRLKHWINCNCNKSTHCSSRLMPHSCDPSLLSKRASFATYQCPSR